ncbi:putative FRE ferric reductase-like transmembrane component, partial [Aureobasidium melanogenum]
MSNVARRFGSNALSRLQETYQTAHETLSQGLEKRINIPLNSTSPAGLVEANTRDPWSKSGKYALGWVYFCIILLVFACLLHLYHIWTDKIRTALYKEDAAASAMIESPATDYELSVLSTDRSTHKFFPREGPLPEQPKMQSSVSSMWLVNNAIAVSRCVFYRPIPVFRVRKGWRPIMFPSLGAVVIVSLALVFVVLYCFIPQPLYWQSIQFGSPPLAIRAGMIAVAMMPWIVGLSMKANLISFLTGIGHERLNVLHRWLAYLCLLLSLIHTIPFYVTPIWSDGGLGVFQSAFGNSGVYVYGSGIAALVPLIFLCLHSLPPLRRKMYELFVALHVPVSIVFLAMLFWHCKNFLTSWHYLWATTAIWFISYIVRLFFLNWTNYFRLSWLVGEEAAVTLMPENAIKVTIPTQVKWKPGQYVYLRMPGISVFENHPFTIASLWSDDFPSQYGAEYRDMVLVFRPFGGFTKKVLDSALENGPWHTYRAFIDGPYGGMRRSLDSFDHVVLFAGGSGITALVSQLLDLIKRLRDGKAVTKSVQVIWALKRPETLEWFKEELRICREFAPPDTVQCQFYITAAKRQARTGELVSAQTPTRPISMVFHNKVNEAFQNIANNRLSTISANTNRNSALIMEEAAGDPEREKALRRENEDRVRPLPQAHLLPLRSASRNGRVSPPLSSEPLASPRLTLAEKRRSQQMSIPLPDPAAAAHLKEGTSPQGDFDFGFPSTPTEFQKNLMRFAFLPAAVKSRKTGWSTEYGRPDIPFMLREMSKEWTGRRTCVFVCGPPSMRIDVSNTVAELQRTVWNMPDRDEVYLHAENYAI